MPCRVYLRKVERVSGGRGISEEGAGEEEKGKYGTEEKKSRVIKSVKDEARS